MTDKNIEKIKAVIKAFEKSKMDIEIEKEMVTSDIKSFYGKNRNPPQPDHLTSTSRVTQMESTWHNIIAPLFPHTSLYAANLQ